VVEWAANPTREPAEPAVGNRPGHDVPHAVGARSGNLPVVVGPRQDLEREALVAFEVLDQCRTTADVGLLQVCRRAISDDGAEVAQRVVDGVVTTRANENGVAGEPHSTAA
jgi:hypothetical protein